MHIEKDKQASKQTNELTASERMEGRRDTLDTQNNLNFRERESGECTRKSLARREEAAVMCCITLPASFPLYSKLRHVPQPTLLKFKYMDGVVSPFVLFLLLESTVSISLCVERMKS